MRKRVTGALAVALVALLSIAALGTAGATTKSTTASPALTAHKTKYGKILFDGHSRALYLFGRDTGKKSTCYGSCAQAWPPFIVKSMPRAGSGVRSALIGTTRRKDGKLQVTYGGHPLYSYAGDPTGQAKCRRSPTRAASGWSCRRAARQSGRRLFGVFGWASIAVRPPTSSLGVGMVVLTSHSRAFNVSVN